MMEAARAYADHFDDDQDFETKIQNSTSADFIDKLISSDCS